MHIEILSDIQKKYLSLVSLFKKEYYLVGGTAIALHLGHRSSIDFDLFTKKNIKRKTVKNILEKEQIDYSVIYEDADQLHILVENLKITFFEFSFEIAHQITFGNYISLPTLLDLAAMKAFALGGRAKWKDYTDLFFMFKSGISIKDLEKRAKEIFIDKFNLKLFKQQLVYFEDIDFSEPVIFLGKVHPAEEEIKKYLTEIALTEF
jgi:hypothetical protein